jgi:predicted anti-sigma-YlaC factor YlaD
VTCRDVIEFLADYFEGSLAESERALFEDHLSKCRDCVAYLNTYRQTVRLEKQAFDDDESQVGEIPAGLVRAILAARNVQR